MVQRNLEKTLIAGNWKMHKENPGEALSLVFDIADQRNRDVSVNLKADFAVCVPSLYIPTLKDICETNDIALGGQDCSEHNKKEGAYTGDISAWMLKNSGAKYVIVGHSERRQGHHEDNDLVALKAKAAHDSGLTAIICVGETLKEREAGKERDVVREQLIGSLPTTATPENTVIAYEPVWAIGTGKIPTSDDVAQMHEFIQRLCTRRDVDGARVLYGGSMKPENAKELLAIPSVGGGLIGGASLDAESFVEIGRLAPAP